MLILRTKSFVKIDSGKVNHKVQYPKPGSQKSGTTDVEYEDKPTKSIKQKKSKKQNKKFLPLPVIKKQKEK